MNGKTVRISATHEFPEPVVRTWMYYSVLRLLGFHSMQTRLTLIGLTGEDGRHICLRLFASGQLFEIVVDMWHLTEGELELAWSDLGRLLSIGAFDTQMLATAWRDIFEDSGVLDMVAELKSVGIAAPEPDGLNLPVGPGKTLSDVLSIAAIEKSRPIVVATSKIDPSSGEQATDNETKESATNAAESILENIADSLIQSMADEIIKIAREKSAADDPTGAQKKARDLSIN